MSVFEERIKKLTKQQKEAVDAIEGPVMVIAGPGSGKTELLSLRVVNILRNDDVSPSNILCLTFTDAAAFNMRQRLAGLLGQEAYRVAIHTFHSFGVEVINRYPEHFYNGASFVPADDITQTEVLEKIFGALEHGNPLRAEHQDQFIYLGKVKKAIEHIKKAGLTPAEFKAILAENKTAIEFIDPIIQSIFTGAVSRKMFAPARIAAEKISAYRSPALPGFFKPFGEALVASLTGALEQAEEQNKTAPLTEWKRRWVAKGDDKIAHLTDFLDMEKEEALADIYDSYAASMHEEGYYDFNDMILDSICVLEHNVGVRLDLQERYLYVLVDEFQDTNDAQMRLLRLLTDHPVHEDRPNIMVVGDDDQAIFKFQGAEISNILDFKKAYRNPAVIVLKENYRSTQAILDVARHIIKKGAHRIENLLPGLEKELIAANKELPPGAIHSKEFSTRDLEYHWIAAETKKLLAEGMSAGEIVVIAREHKDLEELVPYFHAAKIPLSYERQQDVLQEPHILQLITMARFVDSIMQKSADADDLLPEILNYPFWGIQRSAIWKLSIEAKNQRKPWLAVMRESNGQLKDIANFFIELGGRATYETVEGILHELIGGPQQILPDEDGDETEVRNDMFSPFRSYYFSKQRFAQHRPDYLRFLSSLQAFVGSLREYRRGQRIKIGDMLAFVDMHTKNNLAINNISPFVNAEETVHFMSAHKAKGLEFETVFVINCQENIWADSGRRYAVTLPMNLPIAPAGDNLDDQLRLFYVALTRARRLLYLASYQVDSRGKESARLGFLTPGDDTPKAFVSEFTPVEEIGKSPEELIDAQWSARHAKPFAPNEKALLKPLLEQYQLSVTHLQNFLNVVDAGPLVFLEKNLLRFPEPKTASGAFGSAMHNTIQRVYTHFKNQERLPVIGDVLAWFQEFLEWERLNEADSILMLKRGQKALQAFYEEKGKEFSLQDKIEFNFKTQGVVIGETPLTGKIDRMSFSENNIVVTDFKTGKAIKNWTPGDFYEKIKAWRYRQQLIFYKLLVEHSRDFSNRTVSKGIIEFVEPTRGELIYLQLSIENEEVERMKALVGAVHKKIISLDFPDISGYPKDLAGIKSFEEDLLKGISRRTNDHTHH